MHWTDHIRHHPHAVTVTERSFSSRLGRHHSRGNESVPERGSKRKSSKIKLSRGKAARNVDRSFRYAHQCNNNRILVSFTDGTNEYVEGITGFHSDDGIYSHGLQCVTILVGVYDCTTGQPILGLINQPFHNLDDDEVWHGRSIWGIAEEGVVETTLPFPNEASKRTKSIKILMYP